MAGLLRIIVSTVSLHARHPSNLRRSSPLFCLLQHLNGVQLWRHGARSGGPHGATRGGHLQVMAHAQRFSQMYDLLLKSGNECTYLPANLPSQPRIVTAQDSAAMSGLARLSGTDTRVLQYSFCSCLLNAF
jgi:hypothetical protein